MCIVLCDLSQIIYGLLVFIFFFFNDTATTEIYTLSLHDALPIFLRLRFGCGRWQPDNESSVCFLDVPVNKRSEEHTSELQSQSNLVCRLLLEKKKKQPHAHNDDIRQ